MIRLAQLKSKTKQNYTKILIFGSSVALLLVTFLYCFKKNNSTHSKFYLAQKLRNAVVHYIQMV